MCHTIPSFCLGIVTCCKYFSANILNNIETLQNLGRNKSYSYLREQDSSTVRNFGCCCISRVTLANSGQRRDSVMKRDNECYSCPLIWCACFSHSMIGGWYVAGKKRKKKEKFLSDFAFYHSSITNKHKEKQCLRSLRCRWEGSAEQTTFLLATQTSRIQTICGVSSGPPNCSFIG